MQNISTKLRIGFSIIVLILLAANSGTAAPDSVGTLHLTDDILRSRAAFAVVEEEIAHHLNLGALTAWDYQKLRGPVLLKIRTAIHFQLRQAFGRIVNTVDFGAALDSGSPSHRLSTPQVSKPILHKRAAEIIRDFIAQQHISVIIMSNALIGTGEAAAIRGLRGEVRYTYKIINGASVVIPIRNLAALIKRPFIREIWPNAKGSLQLKQSVPHIGADKVHRALNANPPGLGVTGAGVRVAVIDLGMAKHEEFGNRILKRKSRSIFSLRHGTRIAGIIGATATDGRVTGVAPEVGFLDATYSQLFTDNYDATIDAIEWAVENNADVINLSTGWSPWKFPRDGSDLMSQTIDRIVRGGVVFVVSAGNEPKRRNEGTLLADGEANHLFTPGGTAPHFPGRLITFTLLWDPKVAGNDLDLAILDRERKETHASRLHKHTHRQIPLVPGTVYEQITVDAATQSTFRIKVEARDVQNDQEYEVWADYGGFSKSGKTVLIPGYSEKAITVGAIDDGRNNRIYDNSGEGPSGNNSIKPEVVAPGVQIYSTVGENGYDYGDGTSFAAPHVAGVAALILDAVGKNEHDAWNFNPDEVKAAIVRGAQRGIGNIPTTPDNTYGAGLVKADNIIFGGTVPPGEIKRFEINPDLRVSSFGGYDLAADNYLTAAISWESTEHNLDLVLIDASTGRKIPESNLTTLAGANWEKIDAPPYSAISYYLDVVNKSKENVDFTGAATYPIRPGTFPDLVVKSVAVDKGVLAPSARFRLAAIVENRGTRASSATVLRYYRSSDAVISTSDTKVGEDDRIEALNPDGREANFTNLRAPETPGTYYYGVCVDSTDSETDTRNNCSKAVSITVEAAQVPDLVVKSVAVDKEVLAPSARFKLAAIVENRGTRASDATTLRYYRSSDAVISTSDTEVGEDDRIEGLNPDGRDANFTNLRAPETPGTYYYGVCIDSVDRETDTGNNCSEAVSITVEAAQTSAPDLIVESLRVDDRTIGPGNTIAPGDRFQLEVVLRNQGEAAMTNRADLDYYYSSDATLTGTGNDIRASGDPINPLEPNATDNLTEYITAPAVPGVYYYGVCISDVDEERNRANNCSPTDQVIRITVDPNASVVDGIDLYIPDIRFKLRDATIVEEPVLLPGDRFRIYLTVGNRGKSDDDYDKRRIYFLSSPDAHIDGYRKGNEQDLSRIYLRTLRAGRTKVRQSPLIEAPETPGTYYYGAEVQATSTEKNHGTAGNNTSTAATLIVNKKPSVSKNLPAQTMEIGTPVTLDLGSYFSDQENLTYAAVLVPATPQVVALSISGATLKLTPRQAGTAKVKVTAKDPYHSAEDTRWKTEQEFEVVITQTDDREPLTAIYWYTDPWVTVQRANLDGTNVQNIITITETSGLSGIALDIKGNKIYWIANDYTTRMIKIQRANLDGTNRQDILTMPKVEPGGARNIALDIKGNKIYWTVHQLITTDETPVSAKIVGGISKIQRANLDGTNKQDILTISGSGLIADIALDITGGKIYWTNNGAIFGGVGKIQCANLDGTNKQDIFTTPNDQEGLLHGIALDETAAKVYWANDDKIQRANLDGTNVQNIITAGLCCFCHDIALDGTGGKLYWSSLEFGEGPATAKVQCANLDGTNKQDILTMEGLRASIDIALGPAAGLAAPMLINTSAATIPTGTALLPNYPNPFNPETWIPYQLARDADVTLTIYDVRGTVVRRLELGHQPAGFYQSRGRAAHWDGRNHLGEKVASGLYFYTFTAGDFTATQKLLIRK